ncbi:hypothetical protein ACNTMW_13855 [Planosporangium sp. 12N6]|uniref:hypothetical protein n=1 Tax=Planosporangium spinosum TaxID=3402278 RepID=UPI003CF81F0C
MALAGFAEQTARSGGSAGAGTGVPFGASIEEWHKAFADDLTGYLDTVYREAMKQVRPSWSALPNSASERERQPMNQHDSVHVIDLDIDSAVMAGLYDAASA